MREKEGVSGGCELRVSFAADLPLPCNPEGDVLSGLPSYSCTLTWNPADMRGVVNRVAATSPWFVARRSFGGVPVMRDGAPLYAMRRRSDKEKDEIKAKMTGGGEFHKAIDVWDQIQEEAKQQHKEQSWRTKDLKEFGVDNFLYSEVTGHKTMACGLSNSIGGKLSANQHVLVPPGSTPTSKTGMTGIDYDAILLSAFTADPQICDKVADDILQFKKVDPACRGDAQALLNVYLFYKGLGAITCARVANHFWNRGGEATEEQRSERKAGRLIAKLLQSQMSDVFGVDIHPGCQIGRGCTVDHATGIVLGETAVLGDWVYLMHDVTLGATGKQQGDRHPKIRDGVFLGAKCTILGNIEVGENAVVAAAAVVNKPVPPGYTAVGVPAKLIAPSGEVVQVREAGRLNR